MKDKEFKDDWLAKEIVRESKVSAWDFDEGKRVKKEHADHCDAEIVANEHHTEHVNRNRVARVANANTKKADVLVLFCVMFVFTCAFIIIVFAGINSINITGSFDWFGIMPVFVFVFIAVISSIIKKGGK